MEFFNLGPVLADKQICVALYRDVKNSKELKEKARNGEIRATLIRAEMVVDAFQIVAASAKSFLLESRQKMKTRDVFAEVLFRLSPSNKITECFRLFGVEDFTSDVVMVTEAADQSQHAFVDGNLAELSTLDDLCDKARLRELYKITSDELAVCSLADCIVSQMAATEFK